MKKIIATIVMVTLAIMFNYSSLSAQNVIIGLLNTTPNKTIRNCSGEDLMALLSDDGATWIESIECGNIDLISGKPGAIFALESGATESSYIQFNFKATPLLKATNISFYGNDPENKVFVPQIFVNSDPNPLEIASQNKYFPHATNADNATATQINDAIQGKTGSITGITGARIFVNSFGDDNLIKNCKIELNPTNESDNIQLFALRVYYSEIVNNPSTSVEETINIDELQEKYYDLQGRELKNAPETGIYLRQSNGKTTKHTAQ